MNKKGFLDKIMGIFVIGLVLVFIIMLFWAGSMVLPLLTGLGGEISSQIRTDISLNTGDDTGLVNASNQALNMTDDILGVVEVISYIVIFVLFLGFLGLCYYVRSHPALAYIWVFIIIVVTFISVIVSNAYLTAKQDPTLNSFYSTWGGNDFLMTYLPHIFVFVGIIGGVILFVLATKDPETEGGIM